MKKIILLISCLIIVSCANEEALEAKAKHQAETGNRLNQSQKNTQNLFDEMDK